MSTLGQLKVLAPLLLAKVMKKDSPQRKRVNAFLVKQMGEKKGLWLKVGQMLSLHSESWEGLEGLPDSEEIPGIPKEDFLPYLEALFKESRNDLGKEFPTIQFPGLPASLSQVHHVTDPHNDQWVIKAKLPGIHDIIFDQLSLLGFVKRMESLQSEKRSFETSAYQKSIRESFERELDYEQERTNLLDFQKLATRFPQAKIPKLHPTIQSNDFIVMEKMKGDSWKTVLENYTSNEKQQLGINLIEQFLFQYFCIGKAQGDFHPGNFFFQREGLKVDINWIDLGQCLSPTATERKALFYTINGLIKNQNMALGPLFSAWNFNLERLSPIANRLPLLLTKIFQPFTYAAAFNLKEWSLKKEIDQILGEDR
ncbi:MAG: AarF/UbiB family protein, partial [Halobacteriovoraceae bacterium]|nr:AarF/UbiB family protein [Halobacteriovoraceae bacterium]